MASKTLEVIVTDMEAGRQIRFDDLARVCDHCFGAPRRSGTSHRVYKMPWSGDPRVNTQNHKGKAKPYQVRQVLKAIVRLEEERERKTATTQMERSERKKRK